MPDSHLSLREPSLTAADEWTDLLAEIGGDAGRHDRDASFPFENFDRLHAAGLIGMTARPADGGRAAGLAEVTALVEAVGGACASTGLVLAMQFIHVRAASCDAGWPDRLRQLVSRGATGCGALINVLRVEPELGTPARGGIPATLARRTADGWRLTGRKIYATGAPGLHWMLVFARTEDEAPRMGNFLVPAHAPGIAIVDTWDHLGLRASGSHDVILTDVAIPADHAVDLRPPSGWRRPDPVTASWTALTIAALYTGVARAARDWLVGFLHDRAPANLGAPLATLPRMQEALGRIEARLLTNARLIGSAAEQTDAGSPLDALQSGLLKTVAAENAITVVEEAVALTGNHGLSRRNPLERHLRDVLCARIHTPQPDSAFLAAGKSALGLS